MFRSYQLLIKLDSSITIRVGKLGLFDFPQGYYMYTGSAIKNMEKRIERHLKKKKKLRWHIDYLTVNPAVEVIDVRRSDVDECKLNQYIDGTIIAPGFGASDCKADCGSHLKYLGTLLS